MKYITQVHPYNFVMSKTGAYQGLQIIDEIPVILLYSHDSNFSYTLPDDLVGNKIRYTIYWIAYVITPTAQITVSSDLHDTVSVSTVNTPVFSNVRKTEIEVTLNNVTPYSFVNVNIKSNLLMAGVNILVEGVE